MTLPDSRGRWIKIKEATDTMGEELTQSTKRPTTPFTDAATGATSHTHLDSFAVNSTGSTHYHQYGFNNLDNGGGGSTRARGTNAVYSGLINTETGGSHTHGLDGTVTAETAHVHSVSIDGGGDAETRPNSMVMTKMIKI